MKYLGTLFKNAPHGHISVWCKDPRTGGSHTEWFPVSKWKEAAAHMEEISKTHHAYFGWGIHDRPAGHGSRGKAKNVIGIPGFMLDGDIRSDAHAEERLPESVEEFMAFLSDAGLPQPTAVRHSGNGVYTDWLFEEFWAFKSDDERAYAAKLSARFQRAVVATAHEMRGWKLDNVGDLARVTRMPGTLNHKTNPSKHVCLLQLGSGKRFSVTEIEELVKNLEARFSKKEGKKKRQKQQKSKRSSAANDNAPRFESIKAGCRWVNHCVENAEQLPEPDWFAWAGIVGRCEGGEELFHEISSSYPGYDEAEAAEKLEHALKDSGPRTCNNIANDLGFDGCRECPLYGQAESPIALGGRSEDHAALLSEEVLDIAALSYVNVKTGKRLDIQQFNVKQGHLIGGSAHQKLTSDYLTRKVDCSLYLPGEPKLFVTMQDQDVMNLWREGGVQPDTSGDPSVILEHIEYLLPEEEDRSHLLDCFASFVQNPGAKLRHALLITGSQGTGKTFLATLLARLVGQDNASEVTSDFLHSEWTADLADCQLLVLEEMMSSGRKEVYNKLKPLLSENFFEVNQKYERRRKAATPRLVFGLSNHAEPISLEASDRRFWVVASPAERRDQSYYGRLFTDGLQAAGAFKAYLMARDIGHFSPDANPPMTEAKSELIKRSRPRVEQELRDLVETGNPPFHRDLVAHESVLAVLQGRVAGVTPSKATEALKAIGGVHIGQTRVGSTWRPSLWALSNTDKWSEASKDEMREHLKSGGANAA